METRRVPLRVSSLGGLLLVAMVACGDNSMDASDYDQSCNVDEDCIPIVEGDDVCCSCTNAAINKADHQAYDDDRPDCSSSCEMSCPVIEPWCNDLRCDLRYP